MRTDTKQEEEAIERLLASNIEFKRLYEKHRDLKRAVEDIQKGRFPNQQELEELKKKKLFLKDRITSFLKRPTEQVEKPSR